MMAAPSHGSSMVTSLVSSGVCSRWVEKKQHSCTLVAHCPWVNPIGYHQSRSFGSMVGAFSLSKSDLVSTLANPSLDLLVVSMVAQIAALQKGKTWCGSLNSMFAKLVVNSWPNNRVAMNWWPNLVNK